MQGIRVLLRVLFATLALAAPAMVNGQPLLYQDVFAYLRGPAMIARILGGPGFETAWSRLGTPPAEAPGSAEPAQAEPPPPKPERNIEAGRSIYWGALAFASWYASGFWLLILAQAAVVAWLLDLLLIRCLRLRTAWFAGTAAALLLASPLPYFVGFVLPDILAGVVVLAAALLLGFRELLGRGERAVLAGLVVFGVAAHSTHLVTLALLVAVAAVALRPARRFRAPLLVLAGCVAAGLAAELLFTAAVQVAFGQAPLRLPHITAHLVEAGPGLDTLRASCGGNPAFALCAHLDRLPAHWIDFLFDTDPATGIFAASDTGLRRRIADEQIRFALATLARDPWGTIGTFASGGLAQLVTFDLDEAISTPARLAFFTTYFPPEMARRAAGTLVQTHAWFVPMHEALIEAVALLALAGLGHVMLRPGPAARDPAWPGATIVVLTLMIGLVVNALVCGALASPLGRFQARLIWLLPLAALALGALRLAASDRSRQRVPGRPEVRAAE